MFVRSPRALGAGLPHFPAMILVAAIALGLAGCARHADPSSVDAEDAGAAGRLLAPAPWVGTAPPSGRLVTMHHWPYPLEVGNRWDYTVRLRATIVTPAGPQEPMDLRHAWQLLIAGKSRIGTRDYFLQQEWDPEILYLVPPRPRPVRRDRSGFYEALVVIPFAPAASSEGDVGARTGAATALASYVERAGLAPSEREAFRRASDRLATKLDAARLLASLRPDSRFGGPDPGELSHLRYPLYVGARWIVGGPPGNGRVVTGREHVRVPAGAFVAWRLRGTSELFGPNDRVRFWYAAQGLVRMSIHVESDATDDAGHVVGTLVSDQEQVLTGLELHRPGDPHTQDPPSLQAGPSD